MKCNGFDTRYDAVRCDQELKIVNGRMESHEGSTDVYSVQDLVCMNRHCSNFCGTDLSNPKKVVRTVRNKV